MPSIKSIDDNFNFDKYIGIKIELDNEEEIVIGIEDYQNCCETYDCELKYPDGYDKETCIGLEIIDFTDGSAHSKCSYIRYNEYEDNHKGDDYQSLTISINTTAGVISCKLYNEHNGYYPHDIYMEFNDFTDKQTL